MKKILLIIAIVFCVFQIAILTGIASPITANIYCAGDTIQKVWKIQKSNMAKVGESDTYGGIIQALTGEEEEEEAVNSLSFGTNF